MKSTPSQQVTPLDTQTRAHHPDSPSSLQASEACPLFENEQRESTASEKGTLQHKAVETHDLTILNGDEAMELAVGKCIAYEQAVVNYCRDTFKSDPIIEREIYLPVGDDLVQDYSGPSIRVWTGVTGGFPDILIYSLTHGVAHILDWKFGAIPVTPTKDNLQGWCYALAVLQKFPKIQSCTVHFFAPYQGFSDEEQNEKYIHEFTREDMPRMELRIRTVIARKRSANAKPTPKTDLCIWCAKKGECAGALNALIPVSAKHEEIVVPDVIATHKLVLPSDYAAVHKFASQAIPILMAAKKRCTDAALTEGVEIPGFKLCKRTDRTVENVAAFREVAGRHGIDADKFLELCTVSIGKVEDAVKQAAGKGGGAAAVRSLASDLTEAGATGLGTPVYYLKEIKTPSEKIIDV